ncbi:MAG: S1C family serine protease [Burkholderiaceae bacterium]
MSDTESEDWAFPDEMQPDPAALHFDLNRTLDAVITLKADIPSDALTAETLGTERAGNGVLISEDGVILTIGYLITEAESVWITTNRGTVVQGYPVAYDQATGFGLVRALGPLGLRPVPLGSSARLRPGDRVYLLGHGGHGHALKARLVDKREFAGYWEYLLEEALITAPAHPNWSGAALVDEDGALLGVGSLLMQEVIDEKLLQTNMIVPVDLLSPILENLLATGRSGAPGRPWLGLFAADADGQVVVAGLADYGPAAEAGIEQGDLVLEVGGSRVSTLADFLRAVWAQGPAGSPIPLTLARDTELIRLEVPSVDRYDLLKKPRLH